MLREPFKVRRRAKRALAAASAVVAAAGWGATVVEDEFTLTCADAAVEGTTLGCELRNGGEAAAPWPVVGVLHLSSDGAGEARLRGAPVDLRLLPPGHGAATDGGVWWTGDTLVGYERFDWDGDAEPGESRSFAAVSVEDDTDYEGEEWFYVAMAASGRRGIGFLYDSRQPVGIPANDTPSDDAGLNALSVSTWAEHVALAFSPDVLAYSVAVGYGVTEVLVSARASDARATVTVAGETPVRDGGVPVPLGVGPTTVEVRVTAEDGSAARTYSVTLTRAERTPEVTVVQDGFELVCPASASEGEQLACMLRNNGDAAAEFPAVAVMHSSADADRALVAPDSSGVAFARDVRLDEEQSPPRERFQHGYGDLFAGPGTRRRTVYGFEKFDWTGEAAPGEARNVVVSVLADELDEAPEVFYVALAPGGYTGLSGFVRNWRPVVIEVPNAAPAFSGPAAFEALENQTAAGTVTAADPDVGDEVRYALSGGADAALFAIGAESGALAFRAAPDFESPGDAGGDNAYDVVVTATGGTGDRALSAELAVGVRVMDVVERVPRPAVTVVADTETVTEGAPAVFAATLGAPLPGSLTVVVAVAEAGAFVAGEAPTSVTFAAGETSARLRVATYDDAVVEEDGSVTVTLDAGDGYVLGEPSRATVAIADDDAASYAVAAEPTELEEGGSATVTVSIANGVTHAADVAMTLAVTGDVSADDYALSPSALTLNAGASAAEATLTAVDDDEREPAEDATVTARIDGEPVGSARLTLLASDRSDDAGLASLSLAGVDLGAFDPETDAYAAAVAHEVAVTTVAAEPSDPNAMVIVTPDDGDAHAAGHQIALAVGDNEIAATITAADGVTRRIYTVTVTRAAPPLTARFVSVPGHEGAGTAATLRLQFSAAVSTSYATLRDQSFAVTHGEVSNARRVDGRSDRWDIEVTPESDADVGVVLPETTDCAADGAVCTADGRRLSHRLEATVPGPLALVPAVTGVPQIGRRLEATLDGTVPAELAYAWLRDGVEIAGATGAGHALTGADAGARLAVRVSSGGRTATSAATIPVWRALGNPPLGADEEELFGTVLTVGSTDAYPLRLGGYGRLSQAEFGALESTALGAGEVSAAFVNDIGDVTLVVSAAPAELTVVWDGYRIGPLAAGTSSEGPYATGKTPQPRAAYLRYVDGSSDGVRVALSVRRTVRPPGATVTAVAESVSEGAPALFEVTLERAPDAPLVVAVSVTAAGEVLDGAAPESVSFAAGETMARLAVATHDDRVVEDDGSVTVTLLAGDGYELGETTGAAVTVEDDDAATFAVTVEPAALAEGGTSTVTVSIEDGATFADAKTIVLAVTGPVAADYALEPETLELAAGASAATAAFAAVADESDEAPAAARIAALVDGAEVASATVTIRDASTDARLAALALTEVDIGPFDAETTDYAATVAVTETTVTAEPADANAAVEIADAAGSTLGTERVSALAQGTNEIAATVTAEDGRTGRTYAVTVTRDDTPAWGAHLAERDVALGGYGESTGVWSDGAVLWALADWDSGAAQAYELATGARLRSRDLRLDDGFSQTALFSDGATLWAPSFYGGARAYALADGARLAERDLDAALSAAGNDRPSGLWSDGSTWYVSNLDDARLYAYAADGTRREGREFGFRTGDVQGGWPWGLWSDGETLLTSWHGRGRVLAYRLADGARLPARDIDTGAVGNDDPRDVWSDGETLWVVDGADRKLYAYAAPGLVRPAASGLLPVRVASRAHAVPSADPGAPVSIPDAGLRGRIASALGKPADAVIGANELAALESLDARGAGIADLTGLGHAANLVAIDLGDNPLTDLRPLAGLANLEALNLDATGADPWAVAALGGLERLSLRDNGIGDVSALAGLGKLRALDLAGNVIEDVTPLAGLASLAALDVRDNRIEDLSPLGRSRATVDGRGNPGAPADGAPAPGRAR